MQKQSEKPPFRDSVDLIHAGHHLVPEISRDDIRGVSWVKAAEKVLVDKANIIYANSHGDRRKLIDGTLKYYDGKLGLLERARNVPARARQLLRGYPPEWVYDLHDRLKGLDGFYEETISNIRDCRLSSGCKIGYIRGAGGKAAKEFGESLLPSARKKGYFSLDDADQSLQKLLPHSRR